MGIDILFVGVSVVDTSAENCVCVLEITGLKNFAGDHKLDAHIAGPGTSGDCEQKALDIPSLRDDTVGFVPRSQIAGRHCSHENDLTTGLKIVAYGFHCHYQVATAHR